MSFQGKLYTAITLKPSAQHCLGSPCAANTAPTCRGMDSTRSPKGSRDIRHQDISSRYPKSFKDLFVQHTPQMLNQTEIRGTRRPINTPNSPSWFPKAPPNNPCSVARNIILLKKATATREHCRHEGVLLVLNNF